MNDIKMILKESYYHERFIRIRVQGKDYKGVILELPSAYNNQRYRLHEKMNDNTNYIYFHLEDVEAAYWD